MLPVPAGREASMGVGAFVYERHRLERTLLYQLVQEYYPALKDHLMPQGRGLPGYVEQEFEDYVRDGVYVEGAYGPVRFRSVRAPTSAEIT